MLLIVAVWCFRVKCVSRILLFLFIVQIINNKTLLHLLVLLCWVEEMDDG